MDKTSRHITLAYFEQKSTVDYIGAVQGIPVCFDAKECCVKTFPLANIHPHQVAFMDEFEKQKGIAFFLIYFSADNVFYYLTLRKLKEFWKRMEDGGRKSFRREELDQEFYLSRKNGFLVPYLERFHKAFPNAHIKVTNATSIKCTELLENGQVDLIVANYPNVYLGSLASFRKIRDFHDVFIANQSFAELQGKKLSLKELQRYPIIMLDRKSTTSEFLHSLFQQHQLDLVPEIELSSNDLLIDLARIGLGIAFIPDYCVPKNSDQLFVVQTEEQLPKRQLVAAWNGHVPVSRATQAFLDYFNA